MPLRCKICNQTEQEWTEDSLEDHIVEAHRDEGPSVRAVYQDYYDEYFEGGKPPGPPSSAGDDEPSDGRATGGGGSAGADDTDPAFLDDDASETLHDTSYGKKWFVIGVGGAGNNIVDAILLRQDTLERGNEERAQIWKGGLAGFGSLNTNIVELQETYYAQDVKGYTRNDLLPNAIIGLGEHDYSGMGHRWDNGMRVAQRDFEDEGNPFRSRWDMQEEEIRDAQAIMFVHSVTKGTGCGATPVIAEKLREEVLQDDQIISKAIFSSVVIPSEGAKQSEFGGRAKTNGVVGLARLSRTVDAIVPFDNNRLREVESDIHPRIEGLDRYNPPQYSKLNKPLVAFLEAFTMSSTPQVLDREATMSIRGDVFDISDSFRPVQDKYPANRDRDYDPAVVLAPVLGRIHGQSIDESALELLVANALYQNRLAEFDPQTAWGGTFLVYGPEEKMTTVADYVTDGTLQELLGREEFLDAQRRPGIESVDVHLDQLVVPYLDDVFLWGALWNPKLPSLDEMYEHTKELKESNSQQAENLRNVWEYVEPLFDSLGRENMA